MKKLFKIVLVFLFMLAGCSSNNYDGNNDNVGDKRFEEIELYDNLIGKSMSQFVKDNNYFAYELDKKVLESLFPIVVNDNQKIWGLLDIENEYYLTQDDEIVGYMFTNYGLLGTTKLKDYFPSDDFYTVAPKIIWESNNTFSYNCWKILNSYIILGALYGTKENPDYYSEWMLSSYMRIKDISQFKYNDEIK